MTQRRAERPVLSTEHLLRTLASWAPIPTGGTPASTVVEASLARIPRSCVGGALRIDLLSPARLGLVLGLPRFGSNPVPTAEQEPWHHQLSRLSLGDEEVILDWDDLGRLDDSSVRVFVEPLHELGVRAIRDARGTDGAQRVSELLTMLRLHEEVVDPRSVRELLANVEVWNGVLTQVSIPCAAAAAEAREQLTQLRYMVTVPKHRLALLLAVVWRDATAAERAASTMERHLASGNYVHCDVSLSPSGRSCVRTLTPLEEPQRQAARLRRVFEAIQELGGSTEVSSEVILAAHETAEMVAGDRLPPGTFPLEIELDWSEGRISRARVWCGFLPHGATRT